MRHRFVSAAVAACVASSALAAAAGETLRDAVVRAIAAGRR